MNRPCFNRLLPAAILMVCGLGLSPGADALEILRWERLPLAVPLVVDQERVVFVDRNVRVGVPAEIGDRLRVQSAGGAIYLRANAPIEPARLQLQDVSNGALILLDIAAAPAREGQASLEPVRIIDAQGSTGRASQDATAVLASLPAAPRTQRQSPAAVVLTRHAAQSLYAPLRTVEPVSGLARATLDPRLTLDTLLPTLPVRAKAVAAWRLDDHWVTAVRLTNMQGSVVFLDPRALQGDFIAATFQHPDLGPAGDPADTTVLYLVTRGHGLAGSLLPALSRFDAALNLPAPTPVAGDGDEK